MPVNEANRIVSKCQQYAGDPESQANNVKALTGSNYIRLRVGNWRIIMDDGHTVLAVLKIAARGSVY